MIATTGRRRATARRVAVATRRPVDGRPMTTDRATRTPRQRARVTRRVSNRRAEYALRLAEATTPVRRIWTAVNYLAGAMSDLSAERADQVAIDVVHTLEAIAGRIEQEGVRRKP